jgi:hypothetical protein
MANTYTLIEAKTLGSAVASVTFSSIPQTYTDLLLLSSVRTSRNSPAESIFISFNGSTSSFSSRVIIGQGGSGVDNVTVARFIGVACGDTTTANTFGNFSTYIPNYTGSNNKSYSSDSVNEDNASLAFAALTAGLWSNTAAITSIGLTTENANNLLTNSTFYLYGISNS